MSWPFNVSKTGRFLMHSVPHSSSTSLTQRLVPRKRPYSDFSSKRYLLDESRSEIPLKLESPRKRMHSTQALVRKSIGIPRKGADATVSNFAETSLSYEHQQPGAILEDDISEKFYNLAYISSLYYPGDEYVSQKNIDNPKSVIWGLFPKGRTTRHICYSKFGLTYHRCVPRIHISDCISQFSKDAYSLSKIL